MGTVMAVGHLLSAFGERGPALTLWESTEKGEEREGQCSEVLEGSPGLQAFLRLLTSFLPLVLSLWGPHQEKDLQIVFPLLT